LVQPAVQFCTDAFSEYVRLTDADSLFGQQFHYMEFFRYFWQVREAGRWLLPSWWALRAKL
jgi:hypothetical protein